MVAEPIILPNRSQMADEGILSPEDYLYWVLVGKPQIVGLLEQGDANLNG
jgi:hypothetical protein